MTARTAPIVPKDLLNIAQARAYDLVVVSSDVSEFELIENLRLKNWRG